MMRPRYTQRSAEAQARINAAVRRYAEQGGFWTPERKKCLIVLLGMDKSFREIADDLGCTRSMIAGRVYRNRMNARRDA